MQAELDRTGVTMENVQSRYQIQEPETMSAELYGRVMSALKRTKSTEAAGVSVCSQMLICGSCKRYYNVIRWIYATCLM